MKSKYALLNSLLKKGITDQRILHAIGQLPREQFISKKYEKNAYEDVPLPIACEQTISQPYIIAQMTQTLLGRGNVKKVLEIGTGSGYQAAVLGLIVKEVYTVERIQKLYEQAKVRLDTLGLSNVHVFHHDGSQGLVDYAPFDAIIVTAAAEEVPQALLDQLSENGRLVIPVGEKLTQELKVIDREGNQFVTRVIEPVRFVPLLTGKQ